ncbi:probable DNA-directed RNA polymerase III subunit RPC6 [Eurytemora carolleeae]|uniref:probable DNA-directed RNA polymerase III subunit RPC6 n=1 Tax=Eurytemora carolleeae TaxID=1294199 RepID=UPI000C774AC2|nr:probable DNA-directed RNA polymerase III subunit RPC6 [Eurytemora carolleeae]|eukprot:XP_023339941.1 probable DNA-directed RNA polymerase III subunit RPC6 [Eurytemora affinis]
MAEILSHISELGISKVQLRLEDIEAILQTLVYDGKAERGQDVESGSVYRAVNSPVSTPGFVRSPCGVCPVIQDCGESGLINPSSCQYFKDWLDF